MAKAELTTENRPARDNWNVETHENQGCVEVLVVLPHVVVLRRLLLVHGVEIELGVVVLDQLEHMRKATRMLFRVRSEVTVDPA